LAVVILHVLSECEAYLLHIRNAAGATGIFTGTGKDRKQNSREYPDYGYDDQEFNECETTFLSLSHFSSK
jgi:hypothetical protein